MYHIFTRGFSGLSCFACNRRFARERRAEDDGGDVEDVRETRGVESDGACAKRRVDATSERDKGTRRVIGLDWIGTDWNAFDRRLFCRSRVDVRMRNGWETMMNAR